MLTAECLCGRKLRLRDELAGKRVRCPECGEVVPVPGGRSPHRTAASTQGKECPFCHKRIPRAKYKAHIRRHQERQSDGQMRDHVTLPPRRRAKKQSLKNQPRVYEHRACGTRTQMPDDIIRTYMVDPFFYSGYTFCAGCRDYCPSRECFWIETGQSLPAHKWQLFLAKGLGYKAVWALTHPLVASVAAAGIGRLIALGANWDQFHANMTTLAAAGAGFLIGHFASRFVRIGIVKAFDL